MVNTMNTMEGCGKFIKYAVFVVNFIIMLGGIIICGVGIWTLTDKAQVEKLLDTNLYVSAAAILVSMGAIVAIISFLGCCGALKEVKCLLLMFFVLLLLIFVIMLAGAIIGFVLRDKVTDYLTQGMNETIKKYGQDKYKYLTEAWDDVQEDMKCCGIKNYTSWSLNSNFQGDVKVPKSCCISKQDDCVRNPISSNAYIDGCFTKVADKIKKHAAPLAGIAIAIAIILILGMVFSCALFLMI